MTRLPAAAWRDHAGLARVVAALGPGQARIVGGAVRDTLLGIDTADVDIATPHDPQRVIALLTAAKIKAVPTGLDHGTITAVASDQVYEVTTLRRDVSTDGRRATVAFTDDWREDAARRDFTINALYADPNSGELFDYFGGIEDLAARCVRFIGDPFVRIAEDHLRILRFFRFLARFGEVADADGLEACTDRANDLMALSRERIADEILKLLSVPDPSKTVAIMLDRGIFHPVLPEIAKQRLNDLEALIAAETAANVTPDPLRRLAALLPRDPAVAEDVAARLRLSNKAKKRLACAGEDACARPPEALAYRLGRDCAVDRLLLAGRPREAAELAHWHSPRLPITGGALIKRGLAEGPQVARTLKSIESRWVDAGFPSGPEFDAIVTEALAAAAN